MHTILACLLVFNIARAQVDQPTIKFDRPKLVLGKSAEEALKKYDPKFKVWTEQDFAPSVLKYYTFSSRQMPWTVVGDFNGDDTNDVVMLGANDSNHLLVVILSGKEKFRVLEIESFNKTDPKKECTVGLPIKECGLWRYLTYSGPGTRKSPHEKKELFLTTEGFELNYFEKSATLYFHDKGKFRTYTTAD
jgi:hypothetical protein